MENNSKKLLIAICLLWGGAFILFLTYSYWGPLLISDAYHNRSFPFLNDLLNGRNSHPLSFYHSKADRLIYAVIACALLLSFGLLGYIYLKRPIKLLAVKSGLVEWLTRHLEIVIFFALVSISILFRLPYFFHSTIGLDEGTFLLMGQSIVEGNLPYIELWDLKPPLAFAPYAISIWLFGKSIIAVRLVGAFCLGVAAYLTYRTGNQIWGRRVGFLAALMSIIFVSIVVTGQSTSPEIIVTIPLLGALTVLIAGNINARTSFLVGLLLSVAVLIRMNLAYLVVLIGLLIIAYPLFIQKRSPVKNIVMYGVGGLIPLIIVILPYAIAGHLDTLFTSLVVLPLQYSSSQQSAIESLRAILIDTKFFGFYNSLFWIGCLGGIVILAWNWASYSSTQRFGTFLVAIFFLGVAISIINNGFAGYHHMIQIIPLISLLASLFYSELCLSRHKPVLMFVFVLALTMSSHKILTKYKQLASKLANNKPLLSDAGYQLAAYLQKENPNKEPMYLMIYHVALWLTDTKPLSKHFTHPDNLGRPFMLKLLVDSNATTATELKKLLDKKPLFIVKEEDIDFFRLENFIARDLDAVKIFEDTLRTDYIFTKKFSKAHVYRRKSKYIEH